jgi:hypothetical protein
MHLVHTLADWRPHLSDYRSLVSAYQTALKSLARRYLELHDEIADLDARNSPGNGLGLSLVAAVANLDGALIEMADNSPGLRIELQF